MTRRKGPTLVLGDGWPHYTDSGNAKRLALWHGQDLRHVHAWGAWLVWDGQRWRPDDCGGVVELAKAVTVRMFTEAAGLIEQASRELSGDEREERIDALRRQQDFALKSEDGRRIDYMIKLARSECPIAHGDLDADPWLFNCPNGTIDLRDGELRPHRREDLITKLCPTPFDASARCPLWESTLRTIFGGSDGLVGYCRRLCGYSMTGLTREQILPILFGVGSNGKSLFLEAVRATLGGGYATSGSRELLMPDGFQSHPTHLADLAGRRLVTFAETREGGRLNEAMIKQLTGGDAIKARRCHEDPWEFIPTHKMWLATNHRPAVNGSDHGIWRRLRLLPFEVRFWDPGRGETGPPELEADKTLLDRLSGEAPGILAWMVRGCLEWQDKGLCEPREVLAATSEYRGDEDVVGQFLEEKCVLGEGPGLKVTAAAFYAGFTRWWKEARGEAERPPSSRAFGLRLGDRPGITRGKSDGVIVYRGVRPLREGEKKTQRVQGGRDDNHAISESCAIRDRAGETFGKTAVIVPSSLSDDEDEGWTPFE